MATKPKGGSFQENFKKQSVTLPKSTSGTYVTKKKK